MRELKTRLRRLEQRADGVTGDEASLIAVLNEDGTYSVSGETMTEEEFERWKETLKANQLLIILDF